MEAGLKEAGRLPFAREIIKGRRQGRGCKNVVYPAKADTRTGRCNSKRQHTKSKMVEEGPIATLPYHHTGEFPRRCNPPLSIPPARQNPWLFLPCRSGRLIMPRFMPDPRAFVD